MEEQTAIILGVCGITFLFAYLHVQFKEEGHKKLFFILSLLMLDTTILTGLMFAQDAGLTFFSEGLLALFTAMLLITAYFFYLYIIRTALNMIETFRKNRWPEARYED